MAVFALGEILREVLRELPSKAHIERSIDGSAFGEPLPG
jgi:hypothetical protein